MNENLTIDNLARAIHEDELAACEVAGLAVTFSKKVAVKQPWDMLPPAWKACRREQARLMLNRWMR